MDAKDPTLRELTAQEKEKISHSKAQATVLYKGEVVKHHSCGASIAVTFGRPAVPYQSLRRGGITGKRFCGSLRAGEMILGELLGDDSPTGKVTPPLKAAMIWYQEQIAKRFEASPQNDYVCNHLTAELGEFLGNRRKAYCTELTGKVAALTTEALIRFAPKSMDS